MQRRNVSKTKLIKHRAQQRPHEATRGAIHSVVLLIGHGRTLKMITHAFGTNFPALYIYVPGVLYTGQKK